MLAPARFMLAFSLHVCFLNLLFLYPHYTLITSLYMCDTCIITVQVEIIHQWQYITYSIVLQYTY
jgi:hypothetical protein